MSKVKLSAAKNVKRVQGTETPEKVLKNISTTDKFVLAYLCITVLSYLFSDYKKDALTGCYGWYMGLITQISFVLIYLWISRFYAKQMLI